MEWSGRCSTRYLNADGNVALIVRTNPNGWKPDTHVKVPGTPSSTAHESRIQTMMLLLTAANDQHVSVSTTPRDEGLYRKYNAELDQAQDRMGLPSGRIRTFVQGRKRFPRGHDYSCPHRRASIGIGCAPLGMNMRRFKRRLSRMGQPLPWSPDLEGKVGLTAPEARRRQLFCPAR